MISNYADWDVNAKLPHGIESVKHHLKEVDNVPLLVSLFTDVTKATTMHMVRTVTTHLNGNEDVEGTDSLTQFSDRSFPRIQRHCHCSRAFAPSLELEDLFDC